MVEYNFRLFDIFGNLVEQRSIAIANHENVLVVYKGQAYRTMSFSIHDRIANCFPIKTYDWKE